MIKPPAMVKAYPERKFHRFFFDEGPPCDFYVRGAIAWPWIGQLGFGVLGAQEINTKIVYVFEEYEFLHIDPVFDPDTTKYVGLADFLNRMASKYQATEYFWNDRPDLHDYYHKLVIRSPQVNVQPAMIKAHYDKDEVADGILHAHVDRKTVRVSLQSQVLQHLQGGDPDQFRGYHALRVLLMGFTNFPWRDPGPPTEDVVEIWDPTPRIWSKWSR